MNVLTFFYSTKVKNKIDQTNNRSTIKDNQEEIRHMGS